MGALTRYRTPALLEPIQLLDYLEVCGATSAVGQASKAMALPCPLLDTAPWRDQGLRRCPGSTPIKEQLSLVLPIAAECCSVIQTIQAELQAAVGRNHQKAHGPLGAHLEFYTPNA